MSDLESLIKRKRDEFHAGLIDGGTLTVNAAGVASNADGSNRFSVAIAAHIARALLVSTEDERAAGQTLGGSFEAATRAYLEQTFPAFTMLRPGKWDIQKTGNRGAALSAFEPYQHLADLAEAVRESPKLAAVLGNGYLISPDVVITREPESDEFINAEDFLVDEETASHTAIRVHNRLDHPSKHGRLILHAVVSCKWTLRSDRAQNARSEALNLIRNRKGRLPHIVVVTAEPTPSRLASLALGTGDIDCVYHIALPELMRAVLDEGNEDNVSSLYSMTAGRRLKDISDLPLDLTI